MANSKIFRPDSYRVAKSPRRAENRFRQSQNFKATDEFKKYDSQVNS